MVSAPDSTHEALQRELQEAEGRLARLENEHQEVGRQMGILRDAIIGYRQVLTYRTSRREPIPPLGLPGFGDNRPTPPPRGFGRTPGNRASGMPPRADQFRDISVEKAFLAIAVASGEARHADEFVRQVWIIQTQMDLSHAKRTGNSALTKLAKKGVLRKVAPNTYEAVKKGVTT